MIGEKYFLKSKSILGGLLVTALGLGSLFGLVDLEAMFESAEQVALAGAGLWAIYSRSVAEGRIRYRRGQAPPGASAFEDFERGEPDRGEGFEMKIVPMAKRKGVESAGEPATEYFFANYRVALAPIALAALALVAFPSCSDKDPNPDGAARAAVISAEARQLAPLLSQPKSAHEDRARSFESMIRSAQLMAELTGDERVARLYSEMLDPSNALAGGMLQAWEAGPLSPELARALALVTSEFARLIAEMYADPCGDAGRADDSSLFEEILSRASFGKLPIE